MEPFEELGYFAAVCEVAPPVSEADRLDLERRAAAYRQEQLRCLGALPSYEQEIVKRIIEDVLTGQPELFEECLNPRAEEPGPKDEVPGREPRGIGLGVAVMLAGIAALFLIVHYAAQIDAWRPKW